VLWLPGNGLSGVGQVVDLGRATPVGKPRDVSIPAVWCAPPFGDVAHSGHDVYQAALVIHTVVTREPPTDAAGMRARLADQPSDFLRRLLAGTFAEEPALRPGVTQLLDRIAEFHQASAVTIPRQPVAPSGDTRSFSHPYASHTATAAASSARLDFRRMVAEKRAFRQRQRGSVTSARRFLRDMTDLLWYQHTSARARVVTVGVVLAVLAVVVFLLVQMVGA
jgi:hypothetical protein